MSDFDRVVRWVSAAEADPLMGADLREVTANVPRLIEVQATEAVLSAQRDDRAQTLAVRALVASLIAAVASAAGVVMVV